MSLRKTRKGQALLIDFTLAAFLFIIAWGMINSEFDKKLERQQTIGDVQAMKVKADYVLETLVKGRGIPPNWQNGPLNDVNLIGLATKDRELSEAKISAFSNLSSQYSNLKAKLGLEDYDFFFQFEGADDSNAGLAPQGNANEVSAQRIVTYKGGKAVATLKVYRLVD